MTESYFFTIIMHSLSFFVSFFLHTKSTKIGAVMSLLSLTMMILLFLRETFAFLHTQFRSEVMIIMDPYSSSPSSPQNNNVNDDNGIPRHRRMTTNTMIRLNFNVTVYHVQCDFASVGKCVCSVHCKRKANTAGRRHRRD